MPRGAAGEGRGATKLDNRSSRRSAVAAEMLPAPPPPPPRGKLTRAAGGRNPRLCPAPREELQRGVEGGRDGGGRTDRQTDSEGESGRE